MKKIEKELEKTEENSGEELLEEYREGGNYFEKLAFYNFTNRWEEAEDDERRRIRAEAYRRTGNWQKEEDDEYWANRIEAYRHTQNWEKAKNDTNRDIQEEAEINLALLNKKITIYREIREIRNKIFPPRLEFGCEVLDTEFGRNDIYYFGSMSDRFVYLHKGNREKQEWDNKFKKYYKILGKPISLNEIFLMIKNKNPKAQLDIIVNLLDFNLPIKAQKSETLRKILELIKNN